MVPPYQRRPVKQGQGNVPNRYLYPVEVFFDLVGLIGNDKLMIRCNHPYLFERVTGQFSVSESKKYYGRHGGLPLKIIVKRVIGKFSGNPDTQVMGKIIAARIETIE